MTGQNSLESSPKRRRVEPPVMNNQEPGLSMVVAFHDEIEDDEIPSDAMAALLYLKSQFPNIEGVRVHECMQGTHTLTIHPFQS
jgi:hypothetical protein